MMAWLFPKPGIGVSRLTIYECHLDDLEAELCRRLDPTRPTVKSFYAKKKSEGRSHCSDVKMVTEEVWEKYFTSCAGLTEEEVKNGDKNDGQAKRSYGARSKQGAKRYKLQLKWELKKKVELN